MSNKRQRVLPADVYDALELSAEVNGGIGGGATADEWGPCCVIGHVSFLCVGSCSTEGHQMISALGEAFDFRSYVEANDNAVAAINKRAGRPERTRVPFTEWCKELNVVRGK